MSSLSKGDLAIIKCLDFMGQDWLQPIADANVGQIIEIRVFRSDGRIIIDLPIVVEIQGQKYRYWIVEPFHLEPVFTR